MKQRKKQIKEASLIKEHYYQKDYGGTEASPYWESLSINGNLNQEKELLEPPQANPDVLSESVGLYYSPSIDDDRITLIKAMWDKFTPLQKQVLHLVGYEGRSLYNCALKLDITKASVQDVLISIKKKIKKYHTKSKQSYY